MPHRSEQVEYGWLRSELSGVNRSSSPEPSPVPAKNSGSALLKAAEAAFDVMTHDLAGLDLTLLLADRSGRLIQSVGDVDCRTGIEAQRRGLVVGADLSEEKVGFNGIGTALEIGGEIAIDGNEHFVEAFREFSCFGIPVIHAGSKRLEGVLNVTAPTAATGSLLEGFGRIVVRQIEKQLAENTYRDEYRLMEEFVRVSRGSTSAVCALGEDTALSNRLAESLFDVVDFNSLRTDILSSLGTAESHRTVDVGGGRMLDLDVVPVGHEQAVVTMKPLWRGRRTVPRGGPRNNSFGLVWSSRLQNAKGRTGVISIVGDAGTGRTSAATEVVRGASTERVEGIELLRREPEDWPDCLQSPSGSQADALIVDDIDLLSDRQLGVLRRLLESDQKGTVVVTSTPAGKSDQSLRSLLAMADSTVHLPPLRERTAEFPAIVRGLARQINGGRPVEFSEACLQTLERDDWPGNLTQLGKVLREVLVNRANAVVGVADLPARFRSESASSVTGIERLERDAIVKTLESLGGNKYQAAKALGISRTTLYRRLREFRISG